MASAMDPSWEEEEEDEDEEEEIEEVVSVGRKPAASGVMAVPVPGGEGSPGCRWRERGPEAAHSLSDAGAREAGEVEPHFSSTHSRKNRDGLGGSAGSLLPPEARKLDQVFTKAASLNWDLGHFCLFSLAHWQCTMLTFLSSIRSSLSW